jgi:hypothetical protein
MLNSIRFILFLLLVLPRLNAFIPAKMHYSCIISVSCLHINCIIQTQILFVSSPPESALCAGEKARRALISGSGLFHFPVGKIVAALRTLGVGSGEKLDISFQNRHLSLFQFSLADKRAGCGPRLFKFAFFADQHASFGHQDFAAIGAVFGIERHYFPSAHSPY